MASRIEIPSNAKILVVDLAFVGDLLMSTPALTNLRRGFADAEIHILVAPGSKPVIEHNDDVDRIYTTEIKSGGWRAVRDEARRVSQEGYDLAISLHRSHRTLLMLWLSGIPRRIGFTHGGRWIFLTTGIPFQIRRHRAWNHLRLIDECLPIEVDYKVPTRLPLDPEAVESINRRLQTLAPDTRLVAINPNAGWPTKRWLPEGFARVADGLSEAGLLPVLIGSSNEKAVSRGVAKIMKQKALDLTGETTLSELAALLARCELLVTNDSGPMHMAHAVGTPALPIFGPTDPGRCGPWLSEISPLQSDIDCAKCYRKSCSHLTCMSDPDPDLVLEKALSCIRIRPDT